MMHMMHFVSKEISTYVFNKSYFSYFSLLFDHGYIDWTKIIYFIILPQLSDIAKPVLEIIIEDDVDIDINFVSDSNPPCKSDPIVQQIGQLPPKMIVTG